MSKTQSSTLDQAKGRRTDNSTLPLKLMLRRWAIEKAGLQELRVLDLCAGPGRIWAAMRGYCTIATYTPCDRKPQIAGTIKGNAEDLLERFDLASFNIIDVDTYGEPWECWLKIAPRIKQRTAVFLTWGQIYASVTLSNCCKDALGIPRDWQIPYRQELVKYGGQHCLKKGMDACRVLHAGKIVLPKINSPTTYYGLVCEAQAAPAGS